MPFKIEDEGVYLKYTEIWNKIKNSLISKFYSQAIYGDKYIKTKVKTFSSMINRLFIEVMKFQKKQIITFVLQQLVLFRIKSR